MPPRTRGRKAKQSQFAGHEQADDALAYLCQLELRFGKILAKANVRRLKFHDFRNTAVSNWFAQGMKEYDVIKLAGHSSFSTTHKFYLAVADDLVDRAREATVKALRKNLAHIWHAPHFAGDMQERLPGVSA
ncbi:MAG: tyrosine-type recombinase/integrase [Planctomycetota bacterium]